MISTRNLTINSLLLALLCVSSWISISIPFGAITGTTFTLCLIALIRPPKDTLIIIIAYLIMGAIGLPVFTAGGGIAKFISPFAGYYYSWPIAFPILSHFAKKTNKFWAKYLLTLAITLPIIYGMGAAGLIISGKNSFYLATFGQLIYLPGDILKYFVALVIAQQLEIIYKK